MDARTALAIITLQSGQKVCGVHYVPLITIRRYKPEGIGGESFPLEQYQRELEEKNPNFIPYFGFSRSRTKECTVPTEISYCPSCQAADEGLSVHQGITLTSILSRTRERKLCAA